VAEVLTLGQRELGPDLLQGDLWPEDRFLERLRLWRCDRNS
jgi:hypothetical protein